MPHRFVRPALVVAALAALPAVAQERVVVEPERVEYLRRTTIDMDPDTVEGDRAAPDAVRVVGRKRPKFRALIGLRADFRRELLQSATGL